MKEGSVSFGRIADRYEEVRGGAQRAASLAAAVRPWLPRRGLGCDVGTGTGVVVDQLRDTGIEWVACDLSVEMLRQAGGRLPGRLWVTDADALALRDRSVDVLTFVWVLHHVGDLDAALGSASRALRPGGRVISISGMSPPADDDLSPIFERLNDELRPERRAQAAAIAPAGQRAGFEVVHEGWASTSVTVSPNELVAAIEDRLWAHLWDLPDEVWRSVVEPVVVELRALPDPDRRRPRVMQHPMVVLEQPATVDG